MVESTGAASPQPQNVLERDEGRARHRGVCGITKMKGEKCNRQRRVPGIVRYQGGEARESKLDRQRLVFEAEVETGELTTEVGVGDRLQVTVVPGKKAVSTRPPAGEPAAIPTSQQAADRSLRTSGIQGQERTPGIGGLSGRLEPVVVGSKHPEAALGKHAKPAGPDPTHGKPAGGRRVVQIAGFLVIAAVGHTTPLVDSVPHSHRICKPHFFSDGVDLRHGLPIRTERDAG